MLKNYIFTSESVGEGHPDKICDQISDAILDAYLTADPESHVALETLATTNKVILAGEVRGPADITPQKLEEIAREVVRDIGYEQDGFHWQKMDVEVLVHQQSPDIAQGVDVHDGIEGAGDQGIMFGYACDETDALMPAPIHYSHQILRTLSERRRSGQYQGLGPDAKSQVSIVYENLRPVKTDAIVVSIQHEEGMDQKKIRAMVEETLADTLPANWSCPPDRLHVNPTGRFVIGGPDGDTGLTGRKIIVDTYGGAAPHGGGAFSGKDATKVDRSAAYMARYLAKNVVAAGLARRCTIQLAYAIGVAEPVALYVDTHGTSNVDELRLSATLRELVPLTPRGIRTHLNLNRPIYRPTAAYGHFGRTPKDNGAFSWEKTDLADALQAAFPNKSTATG